MRRWEYATWAVWNERGRFVAEQPGDEGEVSWRNGLPLPALLKQMGAEGWELDGILRSGSSLSGLFVFKRPEQSSRG